MPMKAMKMAAVSTILRTWAYQDLIRVTMQSNTLDILGQCEKEVLNTADIEH